MSATLHLDSSGLHDLIPVDPSRVLTLAPDSFAPIPHRDAAFDLVRAVDVLDRLPADELTRAVREIGRVARNYVLVGVPCEEPWQTHRARCPACGLIFHPHGHERRWTEAGLVRGLLPDEWRPLEVRYAGPIRSPDDASAALRQRLGLWDAAPCPSCAAAGPTAGSARLRKLSECLAADRRASDGPPPFRFADSSQLLVLFGRAGTAPSRRSPVPPTTTADHLLALDFGNPLQRVAGWGEGPRWPCYLADTRQRPGADGGRLARPPLAAGEVAMTFPVQPAAADELHLDLLAETSATVTLYAWDGLAERRVAVSARRTGRGPQHVRFALGPAAAACHADRYGFRLIVSLQGGLLLRRAEYLPAGQPGPTVPWLCLGAGDHVFSRPGPGYVRSWAFTAPDGGRIPLPADLAEPVAAPPPALASCSRADELLARIEDELPSKDAAAHLVAGQRRALRQRGRRVLVISHLYPSRAQPGLGPFIHEQVAALRAAGVDARVVCGQPHPLPTFRPLDVARAYRAYQARLRAPHWEALDGVPVLYVPYLVGGLFRVPLHGRTYRNALLAVADRVRRSFDFELIHAHTAYLDGGAALALGQRFGVPYLITEHTGPFCHLTDNPLIRHQTVRALHHARAVFCVSASLAAEVRAVLPPAAHARVSVLPNGVDTTVFYPPARWLPDPARPRFLSVISLDPNKNPGLLLDAFRRLHAELPGARLDVVGDGPLRAAVARQIQAAGLAGAVTLLGYQPRAAVARRMREECDALVLPSNSETFGVVLIEALACGKPLVATDCGGPRDVVRDPDLGALCPPGDAAALHAALRHVARRLDRFRSADLRDHALRHYDYTHLAARLADEYAALIGTAGQRAA